MCLLTPSFSPLHQHRPNHCFPFFLSALGGKSYLEKVLMGETITSTFIVSTFRNHLNTVLYARMACDNCHNCICSFCDNYLPQLKCDNYGIFTSDNLAGERLSKLVSFFNCSVCDENQVAPRWGGQCFVLRRGSAVKLGCRRRRPNKKTGKCLDLSLAVFNSNWSTCCFLF